VLEDDVVELSQLHADRRVRPRQTGPQQASGPATSDALFYTPVRRGTGLCDVRQLAVGPLLMLIRVSRRTPLHGLCLRHGLSHKLGVIASEVP